MIDVVVKFNKQKNNIYEDVVIFIGENEYSIERLFRTITHILLLNGYKRDEYLSVEIQTIIEKYFYSQYNDEYYTIGLMNDCFIIKVFDDEYVKNIKINRDKSQSTRCDYIDGNMYFHYEEFQTFEKSALSLNISMSFVKIFLNELLQIVSKTYKCVSQHFYRDLMMTQYQKKIDSLQFEIKELQTRYKSKEVLEGKLINAMKDLIIDHKNLVSTFDAKTRKFDEEISVINDTLKNVKEIILKISNILQSSSEIF